ncbi:MAG: thymidine kinase [Patescibacteria group bacterium]
MPTHLEAYVGPMFSAKTERLISELKRATYAGKRILVLKPARDTRTEAFIASRQVHPDGSTSITEKFPARIIGSVDEFREATAANDFDVLAIDEAQFFPLDEPVQDSLGWFGREIRALLQARRADSLRVLIAGLDTDFAENPFGIMPGILALADSVEKLSAVCMTCGSYEAHKSQRLTEEKSEVAVGDADMYQARCRACFSSPA